MGVAVELYFDEAGEKHIRDLIALLTERGVPQKLEQLGGRPHVSLAVFPAADIDVVSGAVQEFARSAAAVTLTFSHIGAFPTAEGVVFLAPILSGQLRRLHEAFHISLRVAGLESGPLYEPDRWVPHCTLTIGLDAAQMSRAVHTLVEAFKPIEIQCTSLGVTSFHPVVEYARYPLAQGA